MSKTFDMSRSHRLRPRARNLGLTGALAALAVAGVAAVASPAEGAQPHAVVACSSGSAAPAQTHLHNKLIGGVARAQGVPARAASSCDGATSKAGSPAIGAPPLYFNGGKVMATPQVHNKVVVTPIFWAPSGTSFPSSYKNLIVRYLNDVAHDSGKNNIYATNTEYSGTNGTVHYNVSVAPTITTTDAIPSLPTGSCTTDTGAIYSDNSAYSMCVDDDQVTAELNALISARSLTKDLGHIYPVFTPKSVESCFLSDSEAQGGQFGPQACTINPSPSSAYCAYHSFATGRPNEIYAMMPFPIYNSPVVVQGTTHHPTCGNEHNYGTEQSPNNNPAADVEISPLSHELSEAFTDPDLDAWFDAVGFENGDECAYVYGQHGGTAGRFFNQTVNGHHYLTQTEFSNADFFATFGRGGCVQAEPSPQVVKMTPGSGSHKGGTVVSFVGSYFTPATQVLFGGKAGKVISMPNSGHMSVRAPAHAVGTVKVVVKTIGGSSNATSFQYK